MNMLKRYFHTRQNDCLPSGRQANAQNLTLRQLHRIATRCYGILIILILFVDKQSLIK